MCYTSGTTGNRRASLYSHRSNVLHSLAALQPDMLGLSSRDVAMPVVPLFHANGWSLRLLGADGRRHARASRARSSTAPSVYELLDGERVTITAAVPTVWLALLQHLEKTGSELPDLKRVVIGGSACPRAMTETFATATASR